MSDPVSPSPRSFAFPDAVHVDDARQNILKKSEAAKPKAKGKGKRVTIEEVSDEEDAEALAMERLPVDSKVIFEPKPSAPAGRFSQIFDFTPDALDVAEGKGGNLSSEGKSAKEKHVRWTPSALGNAPRSSEEPPAA
ncbi:hypothetical protein FB451DRAFT_983394, partial [Mycena latifolia]